MQQHSNFTMKYTLLNLFDIENLVAVIATITKTVLVSVQKRDFAVYCQRTFLSPTNTLQIFFFRNIVWFIDTAFFI